MRENPAVPFGSYLASIVLVLLWAYVFKTLLINAAMHLPHWPCILLTAAIRYASMLVTLIMGGLMNQAGEDLPFSLMGASTPPHRALRFTSHHSRSHLLCSEKNKTASSLVDLGVSHTSLHSPLSMSCH